MKYLYFLIILGLTGCASNVVVKGSLPAPLVVAAPVNVGVYYSPDFKKFEYHEVIRQHGSYTIAFGEQNYVFFRVLMSAMFKSVRPVGEPPLPAGQSAGLDGVIVPQIVKYGFLTPSISGLNFYSASITYRITLYTPAGQKIQEWTFVGYGKSQGGGLNASEKALEDATLQAIRDGGARIAIDIPKDPVFVAWVKQVGQKDAKPAVDPLQERGKQ